MTIVVDFEDLIAHQAVAARLSGHVDLTGALDVLRGLVERAREREWRSLLVDLRAVARPRVLAPVGSVYSAIRTLSERTGMVSQDRLAVVLRRENYHEHRIRLWRTVRANWIAPRFEFFTDEHAALAWLTAQRLIG